MPLDLTPVRPLDLEPRADFDLYEQRVFHWQNALTCRWELAAACPCGQRLAVGTLTGDTREHRADCTACKGSGYIYHSPQEIPIQVTAAEVSPERFKLWGEHWTGRARLTFLPEHLPSLFDRVTLTKSVLLFRERLQRTSGASDRLRYPIATRTVELGTGADQSVGVPTALSAIYCRKAGADGAVLADLLEVGVDFEVNDDGRVDWSLGDAAGTAPSVGHYYAVSYYTNPVYLVTSLPFGFRDTVVDIDGQVGQRWMVNRADAQLEFLGGTDAASD
jgi:hypothetical protein